MTRNPQPDEFPQVVKGLLLLLLCHTLAGVFIFVLGLGVSYITLLGIRLPPYAFALVWIVGAMGFVFWQLLYVIPLVLWCRRRGKIGMMKGVIIGAILTALINGACFLTMWRG